MNELTAWVFSLMKFKVRVWSNFGQWCWSEFKDKKSDKQQKGGECFLTAYNDAVDAVLP